MDKYEFKVPGENKGMRLDVYLHGKIDSAPSRAVIQEMIKDGFVFVNNLQPKAHYKLKENDVIFANVPPVKEIDIPAESIPLEIIFEDEFIIVVNKPAGMLVHPATGIYTGTLVNALLAHAKTLSGLGGKFKPGIVHRLDKDTSGLLLVAKSDLAHSSLSAQFKEHTVYRKYIAVVKGVLELDEAEVNVPIGRSPRDRIRMAVNFSTGRKALTFYRVLKRYEKFTLIEAFPKTGRTHQIRVHMAYLGHPLLGDLLYGNREGLIGRHALHALELGFKHPVNGKALKFSSSIPRDIQALIPDYTAV